jgi:hypothetical protein
MLSKENIQDIYPLSPMQAGMFFYSKYQKDSTAYAEQICYRVNGNFDRRKVDECFNLLVSRYDILRTVFIQKGSKETLQVVLKERSSPVYFQDVSNELSKEEIVTAYKHQDRAGGYDLGKDQLMRLALFKIEDNEYEFIWSNHHILMDGWCRGILIAEFYNFYNNFHRTQVLSLHPPVQYREFIIWLGQQNKDTAIEYWRRVLVNYRSAVTVPATKAIIDQSRQYDRGLHDTLLTEKTSEALRDIASKNKVTLNTVLQVAWAMLLSKLNNTSDVIFGAVVSGRPPEINGIESMVGLFINTIPVRVLLKPDDTLAQALKDAHEKAIEATKFDFLSLSEIQGLSQLKTNLINHLLVFENYPPAAQVQNLVSESETAEVLNVEAIEQTNYNFNLIILPKNNQITLQIGYNRNYYHDKYISLISAMLTAILNQFTSTTDESIAVIMRDSFHSSIEKNPVKEFSIYRQATKYSYPFENLFKTPCKNIDIENIFVLDEYFHPQTYGVLGKICLAIGGMSRELMVESPLVGWVYDTGFRGCILPGGEIFIFGLENRKVVIKGRQIFLDSIDETTRFRLPSANPITARNEASTEIHLAYQEVPGLVLEDVEEELNSILPDYLRPEKIFPCKASPQLQGNVLMRTIHETGRDANQKLNNNPDILKIISFWREILQTQNINLDDNFFELGGTSMKVVQLYGLIAIAYPKTINVADLYDNPTVSKQWKCISRHVHRRVEKQKIDVMDF